MTGWGVALAFFGFGASVGVALGWAASGIVDRWQFNVLAEECNKLMARVAQLEKENQKISYYSIDSRLTNR